VTSLALSHNSLSDDGCTELFKFLSSEEGRKYRIAEINLRHNHISDRGLLAIADYIKNNSNLTDLWLQDNSFSGAQDSASIFAAALTTSDIRNLGFSANRGDGDEFVSRLLRGLDSPTLRDLQFAMTGLTYACIPPIVEYITSPRCHLQILRLSGNHLGKRGVKTLIDAVDRGNFTLTKLDLFANGLVDPDPQAIEDDEGGFTSDAWQESEKRLRLLLTRNDVLRRETEKDAFRLLRHSRPLLLPSRCPSSPSPRTGSNNDSSHESTIPPDSTLKPTLPIELQLYVLSLLAPTLSSAQRIRIFNYASTPTTLPRLLPTLTSTGSNSPSTITTSCIPDPSSLPFGGPAAPSFGFGFGAGVGSGFGGVSGGKGGLVVTTGGSCANGKCMGAGNSLMCRRESERMKWLCVVGCCAYEPENQKES